MKITFEIITNEGDKLHIALDCFNYDLLPEDVVQALANVELYDVTLARVSGQGVISFRALSRIAEILADFMTENMNAMLYFYCDNHQTFKYVRERNNITPQAYRSQLFSKMFDRYIINTGNESYINNRIYIKAEDEHFIHLICHKKHKFIAERIENKLYDIADK